MFLKDQLLVPAFASSSCTCPPRTRSRVAQNVFTQPKSTQLSPVKTSAASVRKQRLPLDPLCSPNSIFRLPGYKGDWSREHHLLEGPIAWLQQSHSLGFPATLKEVVATTFRALSTLRAASSPNPPLRGHELAIGCCASSNPLPGPRRFPGFFDCGPLSARTHQVPPQTILDAVPHLPLGNQVPP